MTKDDTMDGHTILLSTTLGPNLVRGKLLPLVELPEVREVVAVQDEPGPPISKVRYVTLGPPRRGAAGRVLRACRRTLAMCVALARHRPSIVMGIYMMPHGLLAYALGRLTRRRVCLHVIGGPGEIVDGGYSHHQWQVPRPSKRLERLYLAVLRRADIVMVVGTETRRYLMRHEVAPGRVHVMSSKIDPRRFRAVPAERDYDLILTAQLIARKRVDLFLRIVADVRRRRPVRAAILGDGHLRAELERLAAALGVAEHVDFLGFHEDTERYYNRARVFVLTSSTEGLSLAMMEAMACGLPAVVPAVGDMADVVRDGVTGYLVEPDDRYAFVVALGGLLDDEEKRRRLGERARAVILGGYTVEDGARLWRTVLAHHPAAAERRRRPRVGSTRRDER